MYGLSGADSYELSLSVCGKSNNVPAIVLGTIGGVLALVGLFVCFCIYEHHRNGRKRSLTQLYWFVEWFQISLSLDVSNNVRKNDVERSLTTKQEEHVATHAATVFRTTEDDQTTPMYELVEEGGLEPGPVMTKSPLYESPRTMETNPAYEVTSPKDHCK
jgi:hypothetical protein